MAKDIENVSEFDASVVNAKGFVFVDFWAEWCVPCLMMGPVLAVVEKDLANKMTVVKVNIDVPENAELVERYNIRGIPNMKIFKDGQIVKEITGAKPKDMLMADINEALAS